MPACQSQTYILDPDLHPSMRWRTASPVAPPTGQCVFPAADLTKFPNSPGACQIATACNPDGTCAYARVSGTCGDPAVVSLDASAREMGAAGHPKHLCPPAQ
ncbi:hypothetical protein WJX72_005526 [[Myrmecia] bisecta]|uniref:Uncharacterized protein n=1 Tax=[Myrmecia] bisecta TaxID=41462 RepID=A0AAW1QRN9_9CHLO